jgi:hypothetical protein
MPHCTMLSNPHHIKLNSHLYYLVLQFISTNKPQQDLNMDHGDMGGMKHGGGDTSSHHDDVLNAAYTVGDTAHILFAIPIFIYGYLLCLDAYLERNWSRRGSRR